MIWSYIIILWITFDTWSYIILRITLTLIHDRTTSSYGLHLIHDRTTSSYGLYLIHDRTTSSYGLHLIHDRTTSSYILRITFDTWSYDYDILWTTLFDTWSYYIILWITSLHHTIPPPIPMQHLLVFYQYQTLLDINIYWFSINIKHFSTSKRRRRD